MSSLSNDILVSHSCIYLHMFIIGYIVNLLCNLTALRKICGIVNHFIRGHLSLFNAYMVTALACDIVFCLTVVTILGLYHVTAFVTMKSNHI